MGEAYGDEEEAKQATSPLSDRLAESEFVRASDPGRFEGATAVEDVSNIQVIARRESTANQRKSKSNAKRHNAEPDALQCSENMARQSHLQDHLDSGDEGQDAKDS